MLLGVVPTPDRRQANGPRVTFAFAVLATFVLVVTGVAIRDGIRWYDRPIAGLLVEAGGSVSAVGLQAWAGKELGLKYPDRISPFPGREGGGGRARAREWDEAVARVPPGGSIDAVVERGGRRFVVRLPVTRLSPLHWWLYAGSFLISGLVYSCAGLLALWASPRGQLARTFALFAISAGAFLLSIFDSHTERTLAPVFFAAFATAPVYVVLLLLRLPTTVGWLKRSPWVGTAMEIGGVALGATLVATYLAGRDTTVLQTIVTALFALATITFVTGFLYRYARSRGEQRDTLRALMLSMVPPYAAVAVYVALASLGMLGAFPDAVVFPALLLAPLASLHAFVRYDLWGSRALLSRLGTNLFLGTLACAGAIAVGGALAPWMGASFRDALAGAAIAGVTAAVFVVLALRLSDVTLFRSRAQYKPTIERLSEELTALTSPEQVALAIERTVRRWLPCDYIQLTLTPALQRPASNPPPSNGDTAGHPETAGGEPLPEPLRASDAEFRMQVAFGGKPFGWLDAGAKRGGALFTSDDRDLLRTIANHGGLALAHAYAYQELEERRRLQAEAWRGEREALVETVAAEIAHEVRYPINYFRSLFERGARSVSLTPDDIDVGREEVDRLERLVSGLKRMATHRLERTPTPVSELCAHVETLLGDVLQNRHLEISLGPDATLRCDPDKMTQVLVNLASNALEACGPNGRVGISWRTAGNAGELAVWDDGPGFVGDASRLFAPWYTTKPRGTGLGLAITHRLVRAHAWSIAAVRRDARTHFTVTVRPEDIVRDGSRSDPVANGVRRTTVDRDRHERDDPFDRDDRQTPEARLL
jgi:signal transduction histidine kinase